MNAPMTIATTTPSTTALWHIDQLLAAEGFMVSIEETGETELVTMLWATALVALESMQESEPREGEVARRVADTYAVLYGYRALAS